MPAEKRLVTLELTKSQSDVIFMLIGSNVDIYFKQEMDLADIMLIGQLFTKELREEELTKQDGEEYTPEMMKIAQKIHQPWCDHSDKDHQEQPTGKLV